MAVFSVDLHLEAEKELLSVTSEEEHSLTLFINGARNQLASDTGLVLISPRGSRIKHTVQFSFAATNNEAEYEARVMKQLSGKFQVKWPNLQQYLDLANNEIAIFKESRSSISLKK